MFIATHPHPLNNDVKATEWNLFLPKPDDIIYFQKHSPLPQDVLLVVLYKTNDLSYCWNDEIVS